MSNLTDRYNLLSKVIKQRSESLDKLKDEFNAKMKDAKEVQNRWVKMAAQDFADRQSLLNLEHELNNIPTLSRQ